MLLAAFGGWREWQGYRHGGDRPVAFRDLTGAAGRFPFPRPRHAVYRSAGSLARVFGHRAPPLDYSREEAYLVAAGPRSSSGYDLRVLRVVEERGRFRVVVRERTPSLGDAARPGLTYPYRLIVLRRSRKDVTLDWQGRE